MGEKNKLPHVSVCVCTYRRPEWLRRLLEHLELQDCGGLFSFAVVVIDNDAEESARPVVEAIRGAGSLEVVYGVERRKNIATVRNRTIQLATGEWIALLDDDEFPEKDWLLSLYQTAVERDAAGVLGPVRPYFEEGAPAWAKNCGLYDRKEYATGHVLPWRETRTGNVLFKSSILGGDETPFREEFANGGEDQDFFRTKIGEGHTFVWCNEAAVLESVPPARWDKKILMKRALLRGKNTLKHSDRKLGGVLKSMAAVFGYAAALPILALAGEHLFMRYLIKLCDHLGKVLAFCRLNPVEERVG